MSNNFEISVQKTEVTDAAALLEIYSPYVKNTAITFECQVPSLQEFETRIRTISEKYPYIKAVDSSGKILGYAYAAAFKGRAAYNWSVETTVYIRQECRRLGIGKKLYDVLERALKEMGITNMNACIAYPQDSDLQDPYLTKDSVNFHSKMGFTQVGIFHKCSNKFGRWYNMTWMEKHIAEHQDNQPAVRFGQWDI